MITLSIFHSQNTESLQPVLGSSSQSAYSPVDDPSYNYDSPVPQTNVHRRMSDRSSISSYTSQSSRHSSDNDSYFELQSITQNMDVVPNNLNSRKEMSEQMNNILFGNRGLCSHTDTDVASASSAFQPFSNGKCDQTHTSDNFQQTQNLLNNVKSIAESLSNCTAKRALTFSGDQELSNEDMLRYKVDKSHLYSPRSSSETNTNTFLNGKVDFKPIAAVTTSNQEPVSLPISHDSIMFKSSKDQMSGFINHKLQPLRILTHTPNSTGVPSTHCSNSAWSNPSTPGSMVLSSNSSMASEIHSYDSSSTAGKQVLAQPAPKPLQYTPKILTNTENVTHQSVLKQVVQTPQFYTIQGRPDTSVMTTDNLPPDACGRQVMVEGMTDTTPHLLTTVSQPPVLKYPPTKVPVVLPPGTMLQQPFVPPEGFDLVAIDAFGRMIPIQYTDMACQAPPGYMYGCPPFLQNFRQQR